MTETTAGVPFKCRYCDGFMPHLLEQCPNVRAIEYYPDGTIKRVEKTQPFTLWPQITAVQCGPPGFFSSTANKEKET